MTYSNIVDGRVVDNRGEELALHQTVRVFDLDGNEAGLGEVVDFIEWDEFAGEDPHSHQPIASPPFFIIQLFPDGQLVEHPGVWRSDISGVHVVAEAPGCPVCGDPAGVRCCEFGANQ